MLKSVFGDNQILIFAVAFVAVLALIGIMALIFRRFGSGRLPSSGGGRGRQPRLGVLDSASVDAKRRLVLIRRDNAEHLIMIGGPTDVVVETNIVRGGGPAMPQPERRGMPHARSMYPAEPEMPEPSLVPEPEMYEELAPRPQPAAYSPPPPLPPRAAPPAPAPMAPPPPRPMAPPPAAAAPMPPAPAPMTPASNTSQQKLDPQYADMAQRLEAALRKPATTPPPAPATQVVAPRADTPVAPPPAAAPSPAPTRPMPPQAGAPRPPMPATRPMQPSPRPAGATAPAPGGNANANVFDSLEAEMASLLGQDGKKS